MRERGSFRHCRDSAAEREPSSRPLELLPLGHPNPCLPSSRETDTRLRLPPPPTPLPPLGCRAAGGFPGASGTGEAIA